MIQAICRTDNNALVVEFDATEWFEQAPDSNLIQLIECGFENAFPSDQVAYYYQGRNKDITELFTYVIEIFNPSRECMAVGFECSVEVDQATEWIKNNRPHLL